MEAPAPAPRKGRQDGEAGGGGAAAAGHEPVLLRQVLELLDPQPGMVYLDCTVGRGGHARAIGQRLGREGRIIGLELDPANIEYARGRLAGLEVPLDLVHTDFAAAGEVLRRLGLEGVDILLADLGFASNQMDDPSRGLSFSGDGPLDMRYDPTKGMTAADLVNRLPQPELADLIYELGEERLSRKIARKIVEQRGRAPIETTGELARIVSAAYGPAGRRQRIHPATRTFLALRTAVNGERESLERLLAAIPRILKPGGVAAVISFQSLEDRLVKQRFAEAEREGSGRRLTRKPLVADEEETARNPRSRSAKLRALRREGTAPRRSEALEDKDVAL